MLTYCIKPMDGPVMKRTVSKADLKPGSYDRDLCKQFLEDMTQFDRVVGYFSSRYDVPFIRTRCLTHNLDFPAFGSVFHTDAYYAVRHKLKLHSNRLEAACTALGIPSKGHKLSPMIWRDAGVGDKKALAHVMAHNVEDVESLEALWKRLTGTIRTNKTSI